MNRAWRGALPIALTLPLGRQRRPRTRQRRRRRLAFIALLLLGAALLALGLWPPAKGSPAPDSNGATASVVRGTARVRALQIGDELALERPDGATYVYEVAALDVVDAARAELGGTAGDNTVVIVTCWPCGDADVAGDWRYVVTARLVGTNSLTVASAASF